LASRGEARHDAVEKRRKTGRIAMPRRHLLASSLTASLVAAVTASARAEAWPAKPVRLVVPFGPNLATTYACAITGAAAHPAEAATQIRLLTTAGGRDARRRPGFV
jgi:hypothetical protein